MALAVTQGALVDAAHPVAERLAVLRVAGLGIAVEDFDFGCLLPHHHAGVFATRIVGTIIHPMD